MLRTRCEQRESTAALPFLGCPSLLACQGCSTGSWLSPDNGQTRGENGDSDRPFVGAPVCNGEADRRGALENVLVFPEPEDVPASLMQLSIDPTVSFKVGSEFLLPPLSVVPRDRAVLRTAVPEAAVHEHGDFRWPEGDIGSTTHPWQYFLIDTEAEPHPVQFRTQLDFWFRVATLLLAKSVASLLVERFDHAPSVRSGFAGGLPGGLPAEHGESGDVAERHRNGIADPLAEL